MILFFKKNFLFIFTLNLLCNLTSHAFAAGFAVRNQSASALGVALSSNGVNTDDASGIFANPAVMSEFKTQTITVGVNYTSAEVDFDGGSAFFPTRKKLYKLYPKYFGDLSDEQIETKSTEAGANPEVASSAIIPSLYGVYPVNERYTLGWSFTVPWATNTQYKEGWVGRGHAVGTKLTVLNFSLLAAVKANPYFSLGLGMQVQRAEGVLSSVADYFARATSLGGEMEPGEPEVLLTYKGSAISLSPLFGALFNIPDLKVRFGFSFRPGLGHNSRGELEVTAVGDPAKTSKAEKAMAARKAELGLEDFKFDASLYVPSPRVINLGLALEVLKPLTLYANYSHTKWADLNELRLIYTSQGTDTTSVTTLNYKNSQYIAVGADYQINNFLTLRGGYAREDGVATDEWRTPRTPDSDRTIIATGLGVQLGSYKLDLSWSRYTFAKASIALKEDITSDPRVNEGRGTLSGDIKAKADVFMFGFTYRS